MKANELRIGNWVHSKITGNDFQVTAEDIVNIFNSDTEIVEPILISADWLMNSGLKREDRGSVSAQFHIGINPITHDWLFDLVWLKSSMDYSLKDYPFYRNGHHELKYVHILQNLYHALTGEELTLERPQTSNPIN